MVKIRLFLVVMAIANLATARAVADARSFEINKELDVESDFPATYTLGSTNPVLVTVTLVNPSNATQTAFFVPATTNGGVTNLPISFVFKNTNTLQVTKTAEPSHLLFLEKAAIVERPRAVRGNPIKPGEVVSARIDVREWLEKLGEGTYEVTAVIWMPPGAPLPSKKKRILVVQNAAP